MKSLKKQANQRKISKRKKIQKFLFQITLKAKRIKTKKLLEKTRGFKRNFLIINPINNDNKNNVQKDVTNKKILKNRASAQKSLEKKKLIMNEIKKEKENLYFENKQLKIELEIKNNEIEFLRSKVTQLSQNNSINNTNITNNKTQSTNINYYTIESGMKIGGIVSTSILLTCLFFCVFNFYEHETNHQAIPIYPMQPMLRHSRRMVNNIGSINQAQSNETGNSIPKTNIVSYSTNIIRESPINTQLMKDISNSQIFKGNKINNNHLKPCPYQNRNITRNNINNKDYLLKEFMDHYDIYNKPEIGSH